MNSWQAPKSKNWQWRIIIWSSLFLIFGKSVGLWFYHALAIDQAYTATTHMAAKVGLTDVLSTSTTPSPALQLTILVKNDTVNEYTVDTKIASGQIDFTGHTFSAGETKRFTIKSSETSLKPTGVGDIVFSSAPMSGNKNTTCQEVHTLSYDLKYANQIKQPFVVNLSAIASKMECKNNAGE